MTENLKRSFADFVDRKSQTKHASRYTVGFIDTLTSCTFWIKINNEIIKVYNETIN